MSDKQPPKTPLQDREDEIATLVRKVLHEREKSGGWGKTNIEISFREGRPISYEVTQNTTRKFE